MDPLSAMSLACNIIQVVDFSTKVVNSCRQLYKDGALSGNNDVEEMTKYHRSLRDSLNVPDQRSPDELLELGRKCSDTAEDLIKELRKVTIKGPRKKREVASKAFKALWKKEAIDEIWRKLCDYRKILDTHILVDLRKRFDLLSLQQNKDFEIWDKQIQIMIKSLAAGFKGFDELAAVIHSEFESFKVHVDNEFQQHQRSMAHNDYLNRVLESLWFPDINRRQETIKEAHEKTFQWIFETKETRTKALQWDDFVQWLEQGHGTYWMNGKAGSGKSTLMNYVYQDDRTHRSLKAWSGTKELCTPSFFFWNTGSDMEKSSEGLLRSLLHQVLERYPKMIPPPDQAASNPHSAGNGQQTYGPIAAWTGRRLHTILHRVMHQLQESCRICIFVDGLDEFVGDGDALIATLQKLQSPELKLCLSSRPDRSYSDAFGSFAKLKLQDLTKADISLFVSDKLRAPLQAQHGKDVTGFFNTIVSKAEGVFLWVALVVKDVLRGLQNEDSLDQLEKRLRLMPSDIEGLYAHMLSNIEEIYQREAAKIFHMALVHLTRSLLDVSLALYEAFDQVSQISIQDAIRYCDLTKKRIPTICAGFLEIGMDEEQPRRHWGKVTSYLSAPIRYGPSPELAKISLYERSYHVNFLHRTSVDFLRTSEQGKRFMKEHSPSSWDPYGSYVRALLAKVSLLGFPEIPRDMIDDQECLGESGNIEDIDSIFVFGVMDKVTLAEQYTGTAQVLLCEDIDRTLTFVHQRRSGHSMNDHWCVQLGICWRRLLVNLNEGLLMNLRLSSQYRSPQSYRSAISEKVDHNRLEWPSTMPVDMLGLACSHGLSISLMGNFYDQETATHLLCCSMWALMYSFSARKYSVGSSNLARGSIRLFCEFLKRGANPNFYVNAYSRTTWGQFLECLHYLSLKNQSGYETTSKVFIDHGANIHEIFNMDHELVVQGIASLEGRVELDKLKSQIFCLRYARTALYIFRKKLSGAPYFEALENACLTKNARSFIGCTHIALADEKGYFRPFKLTALQHRRFRAAYGKYKQNCGYKTAEFVRLRLKYARQIAKVWKEITNHPGEIDSVDSSDDETISDKSDEEIMSDILDEETMSDISDNSDEETMSDSTEDSRSSSSRISSSP